MEKNRENPDRILSKLLTEVIEIKFKLGKIESKLANHEKLIYFILFSILSLIIKAFFL